MDRQYIDGNHVVARYLADQLSESEREAFEAYYLEHPEVVKEMEAIARLKAGLSELQALGELDRLTHTQPPASRWRILAAAAAVAAITVGSLYFMDRGTSRSTLVAASIAELGSDTSASGIATTQQLIRMRQSDRVDAEIVLPIPAGAVRLDILPEYDDPSNRYRSLVRRVENATTRDLGMVDGLAPNAEGFVTVYLDSKQLASGLYEIELKGESASTSDASIFTIRFVEGAR
jgi:hypothetical protein